jgi:hypothetical protein
MVSESTPVDKRRGTVHCSGMTTRMSTGRAAMFSLWMNKMRAQGRVVDDFAAEVLDEMNRARAEETRLTEEVKAKDERIKGLEEALRAGIAGFDTVIRLAKVSR